MGITDNSKESLKASVDIVDIISDSLELKKAGANFKACCPFHGESTPSFVVSPSKQIYHCFGCHRGGDVFKFVQEMQKISFPEAVEHVASRVNFTLEYSGGEGERKDYGKMMESVSAYYVEQLRESDVKYLKGRGLKPKTIKAWGIGYAPRSPQQIKALDARMLTKEDLLEVGLIRAGERGQYAQFTDRVMFPIHNHLGKVVGFSGRTLKSEVKAKYVNSTDSKLFDKSRLLFGYDKAKDAVYKKKYIIIMEGQLDVILSHQEGITTAVAVQGSALTEAHLPMIRKSGAKVVLAYDGDKPGRAAAMKAAVLLSTQGFDGGVVLFPEGMDPADLIASGEGDKVKQILSKHTKLVQFVLENIAASYNLSDPYAKSEALRECTKYLAALNNPIVADEYTHVVAKLLDVDTRHMQVYETHAVTATQAVQSTPRATVEELLLYTMYTKPELVDSAVNICDDEAFIDRETYSALMQNKADDTLMGAILLKEDMVVLKAEQFNAMLKAKQKAHLMELKTTLQQNGAGMDEILRVNERMKGL